MIVESSISGNIMEAIDKARVYNVLNEIEENIIFCGG